MMRITRLTCMRYIGTSLSRCLYNMYYIYIYICRHDPTSFSEKSWRRPCLGKPRIYRCQYVAAENGSVSVHNWGLGDSSLKNGFQKGGPKVREPRTFDCTLLHILQIWVWLCMDEKNWPQIRYCGSVEKMTDFAGQNKYTIAWAIPMTVEPPVFHIEGLSVLLQMNLWGFPHRCSFPGSNIFSHSCGFLQKKHVI